MRKLIFVALLAIFYSSNIIAQHQYHKDAPDPQEELNFIRKETKHEIKRRASEQIMNDHSNIRYQRKRWRNDRFGGSGDAIAKSSLKIHHQKLASDRKRLRGF